MELTKQQSNVMAALKQGNEALKKAQQEVRSAGCTNHEPMFSSSQQQQPQQQSVLAGQHSRDVWCSCCAQPGPLWSSTKRHTATAAIACVSLAVHLLWVHHAHTSLPLSCANLLTAP
jgi:succinate dehydrogenase/fumarate reductase-like Fe-S protein